MEKLSLFLQTHDFPTDLPLDGVIHRFDREGELSGWFVGKQIDIGGKAAVHARMGDWKSGAVLEFEEAAETLSETELAEFLLTKKELDKKLRAEQTRIHGEVAALCEKLWAIGHGPNGHVSEYLQRKKIDAFYGVRSITTDELGVFLRDVEGRDIRLPSGHINLLVPARDVDGKLWGLQTIRPDGGKNFKPGQRVEGVFHLLGEWPSESGTLYICEGFATAASIHMATGIATASAFHAGNLPKVAKAIRAKFPKLKLVICADDDRFTVLKNGKKSNAGLNKAHDAANAVGARVVAPRFASDEGKPTDFNDLHVREGLAVVLDQLREENSSQSIAALPGKMDKAKHQQAANALLYHFGDRIRKQNTDFFVYTGTHWKRVDQAGLDVIQQKLQRFLGGQADAGALTSAFKLFRIHCPSVPEGVDLFVPPPRIVNFLNGTLHLVKSPGKPAYSLEFKPHSQHDWAVNVLDYEYREKDESRNEEFERMLDRVFEGDPDKWDKVRALSQMYGACLISTFPHLFMLYGPPGTGKSTAIILASRLVHKDNACSVDPTEFSGFNMETMAGKLVNYDTDIEMHNPISEKQIKKIIDRLPFRIRRKQIGDIYAPIPAVHIFGGNDIPKTLDGASRAHDRRWTFIEFRKVVAVGNYDIDYASYCFDQGPQGILNFALMGLRDLCESGGHFMEPASGTARKKEWQDSTDVVGLFLEDARRGEALLDGGGQVFFEENRRIERTRLWKTFGVWHLEALGTVPKITRHKFNAVLRGRGFAEYQSSGVDYWTGIGLDLIPSAKF